MKFDISRQPFVPAFLTLAALAATAVYGPDNSIVAAPAADGSGLWMPGELVLRFQAAFPGWARALACLLFLIAGIRAGHFTVRYNLYMLNTCLAIPLYGIIAGGLTAGCADLHTFLCSALLVFAIRNFCRCYSPNYAFDAIFRASLYLGLLIVLCPKSLPLLLMLPLAVFHFHRTFRELVVALAGLLLPLFTLCYVDWGAGNLFYAPVLALGEELVAGRFFRLVLELALPLQVLGGALLLFSILALHSFYSDVYAVSTKSRRILAYHIEIFLLVLGIACLPDAPTAVFALWAVPAAVLIPVFFVRTHPGVAQPIYAALLAAAVFNMVFIQ